MYAIVAHDAGAANHIFAWLRSGLINRDQSKLCLDGPALEIYRRSHPDFVNLTLEEVLSDAATVISGTGWASDLEHRARVQAAERNLLSIAVIDHWTNYTERFERNGQQQLPDQIWVTDEYATSRCQQLLCRTETILQPNTLLEEQVKTVKDFEKQANNASSTVLYLMEPIRDTWSGTDLDGEFQAFEYFMQSRHKLAIANDSKIIIKPHPSDHIGKYDHLLNIYPHANIVIERKEELAKLIAESTHIVGCQTYAMVIALQAGKKVISSLPPNTPECTLPYKDIIHLKELSR